jgi:hypothetical protein
MNFEHPLPKGLSEGLVGGQFERAQGSWELRKDADAYGNQLETSIGEVYDLEGISRERAMLPSAFVADGHYGKSAPDLAGPAAIPDILDFTEVLCFAMSGDGAPFCLDYRDDDHKPSVIWWDDVYWRRVAPDSDGFLALFKFP